MSRASPWRRGSTLQIGRPRCSLRHLLSIALTFGASATWFVPPAVWACGTPPPPMCARSTALVKTVPAVVVLPPGGITISIPVTVSIASIGTCPMPTSTTITLTITCVPPPSPVATMLTIPTGAPGIYTTMVPVFFAAGPPRVCTVAGTATTLWADGVMTTGMGDVEVCVVEQLAGSPGVARLNMELLTTPAQRAHPGDQRQHVIRLTNNDPVNSVTGTITAVSVQRARMSTMSPAPPPGSGSVPGSIASPVHGDPFPIEDADTTLPDSGPGTNYVIDDGTQESQLAVAPNGALIWLNQFNVQPGADIINKVSVVFGPGVNGRPISILVWSDPNNDGDPHDAVLLVRQEAVAANAGTGIFNNYEIPAVIPGLVGQSFFVGVLMQNTASPEGPAAIDQSSDQNRSWVVLANSCQGNVNNLSANLVPPAHISAFGFPGNWMIRALGKSSEPTQPWVLLGDPGASDTITLTKTITLCPNTSTLLRINQRSYRMCTKGSCCETNTHFTGTFSDGSPALGCVSPALVVDSDGQPPDYRCPDGGTMTTVGLQNGNTNVNYTGTMPTHAVNERVRILSTQIIPQTGSPLVPQTPQASIMDPGNGNNRGRISVPHTAAGGLQVGVPMLVQLNMEIATKVTSQNTILQAADVHLGEPSLGNTYFFVNASSNVIGGSIPPSLNTFFDVFFSISLDGITSNLHHRGQIDTTSIHAQIVGSNALNVSFTATFPSDPQLPSLINQVNLNYDGVGTAHGLIPAPITGACCVGSSCTTVTQFDCIRSGGVYRGDNSTCALCGARVGGDMNCDGLKDGADIGPWVLAVINPSGYHSAFPNCNILNGDFNNSGTVTSADTSGMVNCMLTGVCQ